jgi:2-methylcitrate dehydratase PrpD
VSQINRIEIQTYQTALAFANQPHPSTRQQARFSLQHGVAVGLLRGDFGLDDTQPKCLAQPTLARLRACTHVSAVSRWSRAYPAHYGAQVRVWLRNGAVLHTQVSDAPGDPESPMSDAMVVTKAQRLMQAAGYSPQAVGRVLAACSALPQAASTDDLWRALRHLNTA